jgi:hypothetical protein
MNCPVIWVSKLQTGMSTSTMEAEYNAFLMTMRALLPLQHLAAAIIKGLGAAEVGCIKIKTVAHEDNTGCINVVYDRRICTIDLGYESNGYKVITQTDL